LADWGVEFDDGFSEEFAAFSYTVQKEIFAHIELLEITGPLTGRPAVDTLNGSKYGNMKELRFNADGGVWRLAFAFDPLRSAILLVAGDKRGKKQKTFYKRLIKVADVRFEHHLEKQKGKKS